MIKKANSELYVFEWFWYFIYFFISVWDRNFKTIYRM